jgi:hypothetical protein
MMPENQREQTDDWDETRNAFGAADDWDNLPDGDEESGDGEELLGAGEESSGPNGSSDKTVDLSNDDDGSEETSFYTIRGESYYVQGEEFSRGDTVPIQCQHCAFWEREIPLIGRTKLCFAGRVSKSDETVYAADKFSCGTFFIPKDLPDLDQFFNFNIDELEAFRRFYTLAARTEGSKEKVRDRYRKWAEKNNVVGDVEETLKLAEKYMFDMSEQALKYSKQFFVKYVPMQLKKRTKSATAKVRFRVGDWVYWKPTDSKERLYGIIIGLGRGKLKLVGAGDDNKGTGYEYPFKYWKANMDPTIDVKTVREDTGSE